MPEMGPDRARGRATIVDVARAAGVSRQTVSNALNSPEKVAPDTLARVLAAIADADYRPSAAARSLRRRRAHAIGLEIHNGDHGHMAGVIGTFLIELTRASGGQRAHIVPFVTPEGGDRFAAYDALVQSQAVDGFILVDTRYRDPRPEWLASRRIPFTCFGRVWENPGFTAWADVDGGHGAEDAVDHLVRRGYRRIGFLGWAGSSPVGDDRQAGWSRATARHGIADPALQANTTEGIDSARAAGALLDRIGRGGAVLCASNRLAIGLLRAAEVRGQQMGRDLGVVGFDDGPIAEVLDLTTMAPPIAELAGYLLQLSESVAMGAPAPQAGHLLPPRLVVRGSTARPAEAAEDAEPESLPA